MRISTTAERLNMLMSERNLKQVDILRLSQPFCEEHHIKLGRSDLSQFVSGKTEPGQSKLSILSMALNVSEAWLMGFDVPIKRETPVASPSKVESDLSSHEHTVITAYRDQPEMQPAVCRILGVSSEPDAAAKKPTPIKKATPAPVRSYPPQLLEMAERHGVSPEFILQTTEGNHKNELKLADSTGRSGEPTMRYTYLTDREYEIIHAYRFDLKKQAEIDEILNRPAPGQKKKPKPPTGSGK